MPLLNAVLLLALLADPPPNEAHRRGLELYKGQKYSDAIAQFEAAVQTEAPGSADYKESVLSIGQSYFLLSQAPKAIPWLEKLPSSNEANYMLGYAYLQVKQPDKSEAAFARLFGVPPESAAGHLLAAQMLLKKDLDAEAAQEIAAALQLNAKLPEAHFLLGEIAIYRGRPDEAIAELRTELELNPTLGKAWYRLGDAYTRKEQWNQAVPNLQRAVWLNPEFSGPYILLGKCYLKQGDTANAEGILRRAVSLDPNNQQANYLLGQALMAAGKREEARAILEKLKAARPEQ
jgi:tetratricopeptide (TPR) repeat protein